MEVVVAVAVVGVVEDDDEEEGKQQQEEEGEHLPSQPVRPESWQHSHRCSPCAPPSGLSTVRPTSSRSDHHGSKIFASSGTTAAAAAVQHVLQH